MSGAFPTYPWLESVAEPTIVVSPDKRLLAFNRTAAGLFGIDEGPAAGGRPCADVLRSEVCGAECPLDVALREERAVASFNIRLRHARGEEAVALHTAPLRDRAGRTTGVIESIRPIGHLLGLFQALEDKREELQRERNKVQAILDSIGEGVFTLDLRRVIGTMNHTGTALTGQGDSVGRFCAEALGCSAERLGVCPAHGVFAGGAPVTNFETEYRDSSGRAFPVSLSISALRDERGAVIGAVEAFRDLRRPAGVREDAEPFVAADPRTRQIMQLVDLVKDSDSTVLLLGESGTGKGLLAEAIHRRSRRAKGPFVKVNCAAVPETLLESELFGHVRGAFTGAVRDVPGRFELADGGTLFLDEVGELSLAMQAKLLRFLQDQEFERVGSTQTIRVDVRVIAATNQDLGRAMAEGRFRPDLYYRLHVIPIELPPLRERPGDIPVLVERILRRLAAKGRKVKAVAPEVMPVLLGYPWPGNVRELENALEYAAVCSPGSVIRLDALPRHLLEARPRLPRAGTALDAARLREALDRCGGNRSAAARMLGIDRTTLWRRLKKLERSERAAEGGPPRSG